MPDPLNPPDSPPAAPVIPEGLATKLGKFGAPLVFLLALLVDVTGVDLDTETAAGFGGSLLLLLTVMWGRYKQAAALYTTAPPPVAIVDDDSGEPDEVQVPPELPTEVYDVETAFVEEDAPRAAPSEARLVEEFPEEPPLDPPAIGGKFGEEKPKGVGE